MKKLSIALLGAGSMGGALLRGWVNRDIIDCTRSVVFDLSPPDDIAALCGVNGIKIETAPIDFSGDALVVAIKPQMANAVLPGYSKIAKSAAIVSVMAGTSVATLAKALGGARRIVRTMPNLPASIGKGVSGLYAAPDATGDDRANSEQLMAAAGQTIWVENESMLDLVTAVSGSGPAYFFMLTEALAGAARNHGMSEENARLLAEQTLIGAGAVLEAGERTAADMRRAVTSPGGTTEAALNSFEQNKLAETVQRAVDAAIRRAHELAG